MGYRDYSVAKGLIVDASGHGDFTSIQAAINAAVAPATIFIRSGTYTENLTLKAEVNLEAFQSSSITAVTKIIGKLSYSDTGKVAVTGIQLETNNDYSISVTGVNASILILDNVYLDAVNHAAIQYSTANANSNLNIFNCNGDLGSATSFWDVSSTGNFSIKDSFFNNSGNSTVASTNSAGTFSYINTLWAHAVSVSGSTTGTYVNCYQSTQNISVTCLTTSNTSTVSLTQSTLSSGTASAASIGAGSSVNMLSSVVYSSNVNAIAGSGTYGYGAVTFGSSSSTLQGTLTLFPLTTLPTTSSVQNIAGNTGTATGTTVTIETPPGIFNSEGTAVFTASGSTSTLTFTSTDGKFNTGIGSATTRAAISGSGNSYFGVTAGSTLSSGSSNSFFGNASGASVNSGLNNSAFGVSSLGSLTTGQYNLGLGFNAGSSYTSSESHNIVIANTGTASESNTLRIGTQGSGSGQQNRCFIAGIVGVTTSNTQYVTINSSTGQLGVVSAVATTWTDQSGSFTATANNGYFLTAASTPLLPASPSQGDTIQFDCDTASTVTVTANTGQKIRIGAAISATAGTAVSMTQGNSLRLVYRTTGATWHSIGAPQGTWAVT